MCMFVKNTMKNYVLIPNNTANCQAKCNTFEK